MDVVDFMDEMDEIEIYNMNQYNTLTIVARILSCFGLKDVVQDEGREFIEFWLDLN